MGSLSRLAKIIVRSATAKKGSGPRFETNCGVLNSINTCPASLEGGFGHSLTTDTLS